MGIEIVREANRDDATPRLIDPQPAEHVGVLVEIALDDRDDRVGSLPAGEQLGRLGGEERRPELGGRRRVLRHLLDPREIRSQAVFGPDPDRGQRLFVDLAIGQCGARGRGVPGR
jgi:hypothetical protein